MANLPLNLQTLNLPVPIILPLPVPTLVQTTLGQTIIIGGGNIFPSTDVSTSVSPRTFTSLPAPASSTTSQAPPSESSTSAGAESISHLSGLSSALPSPSTTPTTDITKKKKGKQTPIAPSGSLPTPNTGMSLPPPFPPPISPPKKSAMQTAHSQQGTTPSNYRVISIAIPTLLVFLLLVGALIVFIVVKRRQRRRNSKAHSHVSGATHAIPYNVRTNYAAGVNREKMKLESTVEGAGHAHAAALTTRFDAMEQRMRSLEASGVRLSGSDVENSEMGEMSRVLREMNLPPPNYSPASSDHSIS
ncbi:hypothetical protein D9613_009780 [Agrocybe pediades]|uniref:Uncharacterized protein n=1 Tax=Agrocybe pediades TaxID=84607 RepID=A0A8H4QVY4_9AGAR|nr:hypothetical protein D9613_009780 [Agrocybe pediades]